MPVHALTHLQVASAIVEGELGQHDARTVLSPDLQHQHGDNTLLLVTNCFYKRQSLTIMTTLKW
eukprot:1160371-Pelagomonas_calceolata.AAC.1